MAIAVLAALLVSAPVVLVLTAHPLLGPLVKRVLISRYAAGAILLLAVLSASRLRAGSDPQEDLPPVHPVEDQPEHDQDAGAAQHRLERRPEDREGGSPEVPDERRRHEVL